jgi:hypothetical protein
MASKLPCHNYLWPLFAYANLVKWYSNSQTESNIWSWAPDAVQHQGRLSDHQSQCDFDSDSDFDVKWYGKLPCAASYSHKPTWQNYMSVLNVSVNICSLNCSIFFYCLHVLQYKEEGDNTCFLAKRCGSAIERLCRSRLIINTPSGVPVSVHLLLTFAKYHSPFWYIH